MQRRYQNTLDRKNCTVEDQKVMKSETFVGYSLIKDQLHRKSARNGFTFVLMAIGEPGVGKSTFINSLLGYDIKYNKDPEKGKIRMKDVELEEDGVKLHLKVVDLPGYGNNLDNTNSWKPAAAYVEEQYKLCLENELRVEKDNLPESRVHACLYFIAANGLKTIDLEFMRRLHQKVNIIPVISRADAYTREELVQTKEKIREQLMTNKISAYKLKQNNEEVVETYPYAVIGSNNYYKDSNGQRIRGRMYPWGCVNLEEEVSCKFA